MIAIRIYWFFLILAIAIGLYFYVIAVDKFDPAFLVVFAIVPFLLFAGGVHGLIAHTLKPSDKGKMLMYPVIMGALFVIMFLIHVMVILPMVCPDFLNRL